MADDMNLLQSPKPSPQQPPQPSGQESERSLDEILAQSSTDLIHTFVASIKQGAMKEASKNEEFRQEFKRRLFRAMIATFVWSNARLSHETESGEGRLAEGVQGLLLLERDQDHLRVRLAELLAAVSRAVEMFGQF